MIRAACKTRSVSMPIMYRNPISCGCGHATMTLAPGIRARSGTTACWRNSCSRLELDPLYGDVILRRWQDFTGATARHAASGLGFDEIVRTRNAARPNDGGDEK
jgi:hypothetical protein